jgi:hypothetical protein
MVPPAMTAALLGTTLALSAALAPPARAQTEERGEALVLGGAINGYLAKKLPVAFEIPGDRAAGAPSVNLTLLEARYCGALDATRGRLIGVVRLAGETPTAAPTPSVLASPRDCQDKLEDVARRSPAGSGALAVVDILVAWAPWQLKVSIGNAATSGDGAASLGAALARAKGTGALATIDTSAIRLATARGAALTLDLAVSFVKVGDGVLATFTPAGRGSGREPRPSLLDPPGAPPGADGMVGATFALASRVVTMFNQDGPLVLEAEGQVIEVRALQLAGGNGVATVRGRATSRSLAETVALTIDAAGADLKVVEVHAEPELEDCGAAGLGCRVRNAARAAAASAAAAALTARYRGQLLRTFLQPPPFSFDVGGQPLTLRLTPTRVRATAAGPVIYGKVDLD